MSGRLDNLQPYPARTLSAAHTSCCRRWCGCGCGCGCGCACARLCVCFCVSMCWDGALGPVPSSFQEQGRHSRPSRRCIVHMHCQPMRVSVSHPVLLPSPSAVLAHITGLRAVRMHAHHFMLSSLDQECACQPPIGVSVAPGRFPAPVTPPPLPTSFLCCAGRAGKGAQAHGGAHR